jgi:hypothetical protein
MTEDVRRTLSENKKKMQELAKKQTPQDHVSGPPFRNTPGGRRMAELRKRKQDGK